MDDRFKDKTPNMILSHFIEECGEAIAAAGKLQRWGADSYNPLLPPNQQETNRQWLARELKDVITSANRLAAELDNLV